MHEPLTDNPMKAEHKTAGRATAMVLAAGRGKRMAPLTDRTPKPLLEVAGKPLIEHHLLALERAGCTRVVVNTAYLGAQVRAYLGARTPPCESRHGPRLEIIALDEGPEPLETGGGIVHALPWLGDEFVVVNGDVLTTLDFASLLATPLGNGRDAHLLLVDNPGHNACGDFALDAAGTVRTAADLPAGSTLTYAGIARLHKRLFFGQPAAGAIFPLGPILFAAADRGHVSGEHFRGEWIDVGTPDRLAQANAIGQSLN